MSAQQLPVPSEGGLVTVLLVVEDPVRSRDFYGRVLGGTIVRDHAPAMVRLYNTWIIIRPGPLQDRSFFMMMLAGNVYANPMALSIQVQDIREVVQRVAQHGGQFVTPLIDLGCETRCYMRDPDGYLIQFEQVRQASSQLWQN
jgi:predicted enzyme related to lactoylglutathione lyase